MYFQLDQDNMVLKGLKLYTNYPRFQLQTFELKQIIQDHEPFKWLRKKFNYDEKQFQDLTLNLYAKIGNDEILIENKNTLQVALERAKQQRIQWLPIYHKLYIFTMIFMTGVYGEHIYSIPMVINHFEEIENEIKRHDVKLSEVEIEAMKANKRLQTSKIGIVCRTQCFVCAFCCLDFFFFIIFCCFT